MLVIFIFYTKKQENKLKLIDLLTVQNGETIGEQFCFLCCSQITVSAI